MAPSEPVAVPLGLADVEEALALSVAIGWNQVAADWAMMLEAGQGFGFRAPDGRLVATAIILPFGDRFGWISMVVVAEDWRRRGLASDLMRTCIAALEERGLTPALHATPDGQTVYSRLGFLPGPMVWRWQSDEDGRVPAPQVTAFRPKDVDAIAAYDREAFGGDRQAILRGLCRRSGRLGRIAPDGRGYLLAREGRRATQLGPLCADDRRWALRAIADALDAAEGPVFIDVPEYQEEVAALLRARGLRVQRPLLRMVKGNLDGIGNPARLFAVAGPELG